METDLGSTTVSTLYGKVIGIVEQRDQLQAVCEALTQLGVQDVEVLDGVAGIQRLDGWQVAVSEYFFGDMELEMVHRYRDAVHNGLIVFAAAVMPEIADQAAESAKERGASEVVHFGNSVIKNY